jgi:hypothetical protein
VLESCGCNLLTKRSWRFRGITLRGSNQGLPQGNDPGPQAFGFTWACSRLIGEVKRNWAGSLRMLWQLSGLLLHVPLE